MNESIQALLRDAPCVLETLEQAQVRFAVQFAPQFDIFHFLRTDGIGVSSCLKSLLELK